MDRSRRQFVSHMTADQPGDPPLRRHRDVRPSAKRGAPAVRHGASKSQTSGEVSPVMQVTETAFPERLEDGYKSMACSGRKTSLRQVVPWQKR